MSWIKIVPGDAASWPPQDQPIAIQYSDGTSEIGEHRENRTCMLGGLAPGAGECGPGFVSKEAGWLPVDDVIAWKPAPPVGEAK